MSPAAPEVVGLTMDVVVVCTRCDWSLVCVTGADDEPDPEARDRCPACGGRAFGIPMPRPVTAEDMRAGDLAERAAEQSRRRGELLREIKKN